MFVICIDSLLLSPFQGMKFALMMKVASANKEAQMVTSLGSPGFVNTGGLQIHNTNV